MRASRTELRALAAVILCAGMCGAAHAQGRNLAVTINGLDDRGGLPENAAFCAPPDSRTRNVNPGVSWSAGPRGTRSYALLTIDPDSPTDPAKVNEPGVVIAEDSPRTRVFHWVMADIPPGVTAIPNGADSAGIKPGGKPVGATPYGVRGSNVYTTFMTGWMGMGGTYGGYDGPCLPINDARLHHYHFHVMALDVPSLGLSGSFTGPEVEKAAKGHVLAEGEVVGTYAWPAAGPAR